VILTAVVLWSTARASWPSERYEAGIAGRRALTASGCCSAYWWRSSIGAGALAQRSSSLYPLAATRIAGTDIAHRTLTVVVGLGHLWLGNVNGILLEPAGRLGTDIVLGGLASGRLPDNAVRRLLALVLFAVGAGVALY
jgi:hypothetical protein